MDPPALSFRFAIPPKKNRGHTVARTTQATADRLRICSIDSCPFVVSEILVEKQDSEELWCKEHKAFERRLLPAGSSIVEAGRIFC
jgi:hypothetical protein